MTADGYKVSFQVDENVLELDRVTVAQHCEYTKTNTHTHKTMNCIP